MSPRFCTERLQSLVRTLELTGLDEYHALQKVAGFATLVATYEKGGIADIVVLRPNLTPPSLHIGFLLILEPYETDNATIPNPIFHLVCVALVLY
jgi:DNA excision repair protein ERCC-2